jgi:hypothetical protein
MSAWDSHSHWGYAPNFHTSEMVLCVGLLHNCTHSCLLQCLWLWTNRLELGIIHIWEIGSLHFCCMGGCQRRCSCGTCSLWCYDVNCINSLRSNAGLQDRLPHVVITTLNVCEPVSGYFDGMLFGPCHLLAVLHGI